jgi:signal transduction histidine kinase
MDVEAMNDVVTNLVTNSWKYRHGDAAHIRVRTLRRGRRAEVVVTDDGIGIPRAERRRVFETFYRAEAYLHRTVAGTGLGLSLVRSIVRAHKGTIRIESGEGGKGTTFRLRFPLDRKAARAPAPAARPAPTPSAKSEAQATP